MNTCACGAALKGSYTQCFKCKQAAAVKEAYDLGYQTGFLSGERGKTKGFEMTKERWRQLVQLCHPDKHHSSVTSIEISQWLNEVKPE